MKIGLSRQTKIWLICSLTFAAINVRETKTYLTILAKSLESNEANLGAESPLLVPSTNTTGTLVHQPRRVDAALPANSITDGVLLYPQNPILFVNTILECLKEPKCHLMYHHIPKTAGTFIASSFHPVFENGQRYRSSEWCCFEIIMDKFFNNTHDYCAQRKMGVYEVRGFQYAQVLETCEKEYSKDGHTYIGLVSTREPIQRTISLIHQQCNAGYAEKNPRYQSFCRNCTYEMHSQDSVAFWQHFIDDTNTAFRTMDEYLTARKSISLSPDAIPIEESKGEPIHHFTTPILVIDTSMVNDLFHIMDIGLAKNNQTSLERGIQNAEDLSICNFGMTSAMLKLLKPANSIFLDLWSGHGDTKRKTHQA